MSLAKISTLAVAALALLSGSAVAAQNSQFTPYEFLVGDWNVAPESGGPSLGVQRFRWGPNESYLQLSQTLRENGKEVPHFEGILVWNGVHKNLDMLLTIDLQRGLAQEQGTFAVTADGEAVREITGTFSEGVRTADGKAVTGPDGATQHFRETYKRIAPDKVLTTLMRETANGWTPTFPGSDHLLMTRINNG